MNPTLPFPHCTFYQASNLFSLKVTLNKQATKIRMALSIPVVSTKEIENTASLLQLHLPSVLYSMCFNDEKLPFAVEVQSTEIGHLFEHILLEYLCHYKLLTGLTTAEYSGVTQWNWERDPWGVFNITINVGCSEVDVFTQAAQQSILLMQIILAQSNPQNLTIPIHAAQAPSIYPFLDQLEA